MEKLPELELDRTVSPAIVRKQTTNSMIYTSLDMFVASMNDEILFELITESRGGKVRKYKIYAGGKVEGFGKHLKSVRIWNRFRLLASILYEYQKQNK
ncbi:MAG: hypothetical protein ABIJ40_06735 [Bacteroidota bacterium]